ncbi:MAG: DUF4440 domain-containing protein [Bryobacterales bacterium]|nr:DUF4440 domain-containing protein [Bryobacterales bacterium]
MKTLTLFLIAAALTTSSCTTTSPPRNPVVDQRAALESAIREVRAASASRAAALEKGDIEGALAAYLEDAVWLPSHSEEFVGKELARAKLKVFLDAAAIREEYQPEEHTLLAPDVLLERGNFAVEMTPVKGGQTVQDSGTYLNIWRKESSESNWKIAYQMWTSHRSFGDAVEQGAAK